MECPDGLESSSSQTLLCLVEGRRGWTVQLSGGCLPNVLEGLGSRRNFLPASVAQWQRTLWLVQSPGFILSVKEGKWGRGKERKGGRREERGLRPKG